MEEAVTLTARAWVCDAAENVLRTYTRPALFRYAPRPQELVHFSDSLLLSVVSVLHDPHAAVAYVELTPLVARSEAELDFHDYRLRSHDFIEDQRFTDTICNEPLASAEETFNYQHGRPSDEVEALLEMEA